MPLIHVTLTPGAFDPEEKDRFAAALTEAAIAAESVADDPAARARAIVMIDELPAGGFYSAGVPAQQWIRGAFARWSLSTGIVDAARKQRFAVALQAAAQGAVKADDGRPVVTSCIVDEVPEGQWAQTGRIVRLPDVTAVARFEHLASALAAE